MFARRVSFLLVSAVLGAVVCGPRRASAQDCPSCIPPYRVAVTPDNLAAPSRPNQTSGWTASFTVENTGTEADVYEIQCWGTAGVTCTGTNFATVSLGPGAQRIVVATYSVGAPGTGQLTLSALPTVGDLGDGGSYNVAIVVPAGAPVVDATPYNFNKQDYGRCAQACFAATYAQGNVPYFSLDAPRSVTLAYNGDRLNPKPFVHVDVTPDLSQGTPTQYRLQVKVNGLFVTFLNGETTLRFAYATSSKVRLGGQFDGSIYSTGAYPVEIIVASLVGSNLYFRTVTTKLVVVNTVTSPVAKGWTVAGVQRLYDGGEGSVVITEGDGSAVYFAYSGGTFTAPPGEFSQLKTGIPGGGSGWTRRWPDSTKVVFNTLGLMTEIRDRFNNITSIAYDASNRVSKVRDPINLPITLTYGANGLSAIQDTMGRVTSVTVDGSGRLTAITDPDNVPTTFGYDGSLRLSTITNRGGKTTTLGYDTQSGKLATVTAPSINFVGTNGADSTGSPVTTFAPWQKVGVPYGSTSTPVAAPTADTVYARVTDPGGHLTRFTVNRWGTPAIATDPLARVTTVTFDANGLPIRVLYPTGVKDTAAYNTSGLPVYTRAAGDSAVNTRYAAWGQADSVWGFGRPAVRLLISTNGRVDWERIAGGTADSARTSYAYDSRGRVVVAVDPEGHLLANTWYDGINGNRGKDSVPGGRVTTYAYDTYGRPTYVDAPGGAGRGTSYDALNRVIRDSTAGASAVAYTYDALHLRTVTDPKGQTYGFAYNALGWTMARTDPANHADTLRYDREGLLRRIKNRRGQSVDLAYDAGHRVTNKSGTNTDTTSWAYPTDTVVVATSPWAVDSQFFSRIGRLDSLKTKLASHIFTQRFRYTTAGSLDSVQVANGAIAFLARKYLWNTNVGRLTAIRLAGGGNTSLATNRDGLVTTQTMPGQSAITRVYTSVHDDALISTEAGYANTVNRYVSFDSLGRIARQINGDGLTGREFTYNSLGRLVLDAPTSWIDTTPLQEPSNPCTQSTFYDPNDPYGHNCTYDPPPETPPPSGHWSTGAGTVFDYDVVGNRLDQGGSYGTGNRIRQLAGCTYVTDSTGDGNVLSRTCGSEVVQFSWTAESRLASLKVGADSLAFHYDAAGRLVRKDRNGSVQTYFLWQGDNLLAELDSTATGKIAEYSYYPGLDNLHAVISGTTPYFAHADAMGNVIALTDSATQSVQRSYTYDAWGQLVAGTDAKPFTNTDRARFKGALWLGPQVDVYFMRARWYEAKSGRFLSEDPIGMAGGLNPYTFSGNDPVNGRDPTGLLSCSDGVIIIIDDVPVGCSQELLDMVDAWFMDHHLMSLDEAWAQGGYTQYFSDGERRVICPRRFVSGHCEQIAGALAGLVSHQDPQCFDLGLRAMNRFRRGRFMYWEGLYQGGYVAYARDAWIPFSPYRHMIITSEALQKYNLANVIAHEEYHFYLNRAGRGPAHNIDQNDIFWQMGDHCGGLPRKY